MRALAAGLLLAALPVLVAGCGGGGGSAKPRPVAGGSASQTSTSTAVVTSGKARFSPLHVSGNKLFNASGQRVVLHGIDRAGSEYSCSNNTGFFDGTNTVAAEDAQPPRIASWHVNSEMLGLNEDCWLGINGVNPAYGGANYRAAIEHEVKTIEANGMYPVIAYFWGAPGKTVAKGQPTMPDNDHTPLFWEEVADAFKNDPDVIFRLQEEPTPPGTGVAQWQCWSRGDVSYSTASDHTPPTPPTPTGTPDKCSAAGMTTKAVGFQSLINIVRGTGARNIIQVPGVANADMLSCSTSENPNTCGFLDSRDGIRVTDPLSPSQLMADVDVYPETSECGGAGAASLRAGNAQALACYNATYGPVARVMPLDAGEIGENASNTPIYQTAEVDTLMKWLDSMGQSYYAWAWDPYAGLIISYSSPTPQAPWGVDYYDHINHIVPPPPAHPTDGIALAFQAAPCTTLAPGGSYNPYITLSSAVAAGDDLFLVNGGLGYTAAAQDIKGVSDNVNGAWRRLENSGSQLGGSSQYAAYSVYELLNSKAAAAGTLKITLSGTASTYSNGAAVVLVASGVASVGSTAFATTIQGNAGAETRTTFASPPVTEKANDVVLGVYGGYTHSYQGFTAPGGWNLSNSYWTNCGAAAAMDWKQPSTSGSAVAKIVSSSDEYHYAGAIDLHP
jgi:endoglucanase